MYTYRIRLTRYQNDFVYTVSKTRCVFCSPLMSNGLNMIHHSKKNWGMLFAPHTFDVCPAASNLRIDDKPCACNESDDVDDPLT